MTIRAGDLTGFIRANIAIASPPLVGEVRLHLASQSVPLWEKTEGGTG
jgi:predicted nicotinamide N-methyase